VTDEDAVLAANEAFYAAFESRDMGAMDGVWEHTERVVCTHPGWPRLRGWDVVRDSWARLLAGPQHLQFVLTTVDVEVAGDVAWVHLDENLLDGASTGTVAAVNVFRRTGSGRWLMIVHHGSSVVVG
jgi:ketosteroid isomerase-like protein